MEYFEVKMKVRDYECDSQGVVNNANYQHYFENARHEFMEYCGLKLRELTAQNIVPVVRNIWISYKNSLRGSDEFVCRIYVEREGLKYIFRQEIYLLPERKLCTKGVVETVCLIDGKLTAPKLFDEVFKDYLVFK